MSKPNFVLNEVRSSVAGWPGNVHLVGMAGYGYDYCGSLDSTTFEPSTASGKLVLMPADSDAVFFWMAVEWANSASVGENNYSAVVRLGYEDDRALWLIMDNGDGNNCAKDFWGHAKKWVRPEVLTFSTDSIDFAEGDQDMLNENFKGCSFISSIKDIAQEALQKNKPKNRVMTA